MTTGGYVAVGIGVLALGLVAYFLIKSNGTSTARPASPQGNQTLATVGQVATGVGALAGLGTSLVNAYNDN